MRDIHLRGILTCGAMFGVLEFVSSMVSVALPETWAVLIV